MQKEKSLLVLQSLSTCRFEIEQYFEEQKEAESLKTYIIVSLEKLANFVRVRSGIEVAAPSVLSTSSSKNEEKSSVSDPLTHVMGRKIKCELESETSPIFEESESEWRKKQKEIEVKEDEAQIVLAAKEYTAEAETLLKNLHNLSEDEIFDQFSEPAVRIAAKKVGLPVTEESPKKANQALILKIKTADKKRIEANSQAVPQQDGEKSNQSDQNDTANQQ